MIRRERHHLLSRLGDNNEAVDGWDTLEINAHQKERTFSPSGKYLEIISHTYLLSFFSLLSNHNLVTGWHFHIHLN